MKHVKNKDHVSCLHFALRLRPAFDGAGEPGIFSAPEPRGKLGIFPSPRAHMEENEERQLAPSNRNFSNSQSLRGSSEFFSSPRAHIKGNLGIFSTPRA